MSYPGEQPPTAPGQPTQPWPPQQPAYGPPAGYASGGPSASPPNPKLAFWTSPAGIISMLAIAGVLVLVLLGVVNRLSGPASDNFTVAVTSCNATGSTSVSTATIGLSVRNDSKQVRSATVKIEYRDGGGTRIDTDTAYVRNIQPGDTARTDESTLLDAAPTGQLSCVVTGIS